jgi:hypothetical protein
MPPMYNIWRFIPCNLKMEGWTELSQSLMNIGSGCLFGVCQKKEITLSKAWGRATERLRQELHHLTFVFGNYGFIGNVKLAQITTKH